ncbi:thiamine biosynthesis protein X [uncultured Corynebacterium sp.]|uniref:thiamine biosynthesis protein X n=1 Tax=uncultured Corynebacterium sp. TaxID=159447 RepID=UPI0025F9A3D4|nr:thiamine biosynthesis protein X [uncultured Corynebacterium sp.]
MKKYSRSLTLGMGVVVALTLTACHPPHQKDSDTKVENASTFTGVAPAQAEHSATAAPATSAAMQSAEDGASAVETTAETVVEGAVDTAESALATTEAPAQ